MDMRQTLHRKRVRHYDEPGHFHELTFSCYRRMPLLSNNRWRSMLSHSIDRAVEHHGYRLVAFVYMPEHIHLLVYPHVPGARVSALLKAIKQPFSFRVKELLQNAGSSLLPRLTVQERPGKTVFRFWQEGGGYDRNLTEQKTILAAIDYIHLNPVRRDLADGPSDWRWSSCRFFCDLGEKDPGLPRIHGLPREVADS